MHVASLFRACTLTAATLLSACASTEGGAETESDIQRGKSESGYPAVGMLAFASGAFGTGTLIRPDVVLTAGHVVDGSIVEFYYGAPKSGTSTHYLNLQHVKVADKVRGECYEAPGATLRSTCPGVLDIGLVRLATPIRDVEPILMDERTAAQILVDASASRAGVAVGFGCHTTSTGAHTYRERRSATSFLDRFNTTEILVKSATGIATSGDSGGPLLLGGKIIGTVRGSVIRTKDGDPCGRVLEGYTRLDLSLPWIKSHLEKWNAL
ncbi:MAG: trypsin-like serine protease [Polyangiaceae bacterium]